MKYIRSELSLETQLHDESVNASIRCIAKVLRVAGVPFAIPELIKRCRTELGAAVDCLWKSASIFARKAKEECTAEYQLIFSIPGESYTAEKQVNYSPPPTLLVGSSRVACTTQVGVQREPKIRKPGHPLKASVLMKATAALDSEISEMLRLPM